LIQKSYGVYEVANASCSKEEIGLGDGSKIDEKKGAMISTTEIIAFQLMKEAGTEEFRRLLKLLK
jgi:hypothetical protein